MPTPTTLALTVLWQLISGEVYKKIPFQTEGYLTETVGGAPVVGKTVSLRYNGTALGSDSTDSNGKFEIQGTIDDTPGSYTLTAEFLGDAIHDPSSDTEPITLAKIPTNVTILITNSHPQNQYSIATGALYNVVGDGGLPLVPTLMTGKTITVKYDGTIAGTDTTDNDGEYAVGVLIASIGTYTIKAEFAEEADYQASDDSDSIQIVTHKYPKPEDAETDCYGWILCVDPKNIRGGPIYYLLDTARIMPGLTERSGSFMGTLNDNESEDKPNQWDMFLLRDGAEFILDQDEFWIGIQRGPVNKDPFPENDVWNPSGGVDGKGSGRKWIMGGYICKRYYIYNQRTEIIAVIVGKDYMDVWRDQPIGTAKRPRNYSEPTRLDKIAVDILVDVNILQDDDYEYIGHPTYFPGFSPLKADVSFTGTAVIVEDTTPFSPGQALIWDDAEEDGEIVMITSIIPASDQLNISAITNVNGYQVSNNARIMMLAISDTWEKEIKEEMALDLMQDMAEEITYEWTIDHMRQVMLYPRISPPTPTNQDIRYNTNIQHSPEIMLGDTSEIITHVIVTDGEPQTIPSDIDTWCLTEGVWQDVNAELRAYTAATNPPPPNAMSGAYSDATLIWDDEGHPALCFQHMSPASSDQFILHLTYYVDGSLDEVGARMGLDLRIWRRLLFKWRHRSRPSNWLSFKPGAFYRIFIHTTYDDFYFFEFGEGTQEANGDSNHDTVDDQDWSLIDLILPEPDEDGGLFDAKGWTKTGSPDLREINWIHFSCQLPETSPGYGPGQAISPGASAGDRYVTVPAASRFAGMGGGFTGEKKLFSPPFAVLGSENVEIDSVNPAEAPGGENIRLRWPLNNAHGGGSQLRLRGGRIICFSQVHFERNVSVQEEASVKVGPNRYRIAQAKELEYLKEIEGKAVQVLGQEGEPRKWVKIIVDGDPEKMIGYRVTIHLDPSHGAVFQNVPMVIDDISYTLRSALLEQELLLGLMTETAKPREINEFTALDSTGRALRDIGLRRLRVIPK